MDLLVLSARTQRTRHVSLVPARDWGDGTGGLLGTTIRFGSFSAAMDHCWHVLDVHAGSPAAAAGLLAFRDYIIGTPDALFRSDRDLEMVLGDAAGR